MQKVLYNFIARQAHYCVLVITLAKGRCFGQAQPEKRLCVRVHPLILRHTFFTPIPPRFWFLPFCILPEYIHHLLNFLNKNTISGFLDVRTMTKWFYSHFWKWLNLVTIVFYDNLRFHVAGLLLYHHFPQPQLWTISYLRIGGKQIPFPGIHFNGKKLFR